MPKMICFQCHVELVIEKSGVDVVEMFSQPPQPYQLFQADAWKCPGCGAIVIAGFAHEPLAEHWQDDFDAILNRMIESKNANAGWLVKSFESVDDAKNYS